MESSVTYYLLWSLLICPFLGKSFPQSRPQGTFLKELLSNPLNCLGKELLNSDYFKMCDILYISEDFFDPEPVLCTEINDATLQLCELNKLLVENPIKIPQNKAELNDVLNTFRSNYGHNSTLKSFCAYAKNGYNVGINNSMSQHAKKLKMYFENKCERLCGDIDEVKIHPLCEIIVWSKAMLSKNNPNRTQNVRSKSISMSNGELIAKDGYLVPDHRIGAEPNANNVSPNPEHVTAEKVLHYSSNIQVIPRSKPINSTAAVHFSKPISKINTVEDGDEPSIEATDNLKLGVGLKTTKSEYNKSEALTSNAKTPLMESTDLLPEDLSLKNNKNIESGVAVERHPKAKVEGNTSPTTSAVNSNSKSTMLETDILENTQSQFHTEPQSHRQFENGKVPQNRFNEDKNTVNNISDNKNVSKIFDKSPNEEPKVYKNVSTSREKYPIQEPNLSEKPSGFPEEHRGVTIQILDTENQPNPVTIDKPDSNTERFITPTKIGKYPMPTRDESVAVEELVPINENGNQGKPSEPNAVDEVFPKQNEDQGFVDDDRQFLLPEHESEQLNDIDNQDASKLPRKEYVIKDPFVEAEDSHFFTYFMMMTVVCIIGYLVFHSKRKLCALAVEGRRSRSTPRRRPNTASYSKLDCNLEEALTSNKSAASVTHVLY